MSDLLNTLLSEIDNEYAAVVDDGVAAGDVSGFIGTGSYAMNALLSGSIYGGLPQNKVTAFAGEPSVGKTFLPLTLSSSS
jgi:RecA/RadA recombinase